MGSDERQNWLVAAWAAVQEIPIGPFLIAADKARKTCDHPAKIVPAIFRESEELTAAIRRNVKAEPVPARPALSAPVRELPDDEQVEVAGMMGELISKLRASGNSAA